MEQGLLVLKELKSKGNNSARHNASETKERGQSIWSEIEMYSEFEANQGHRVRSYLKSLEKRESWSSQDDKIASEGASEMVGACHEAWWPQLSLQLLHVFSDEACMCPHAYANTINKWFYFN